jgi:hypothetical protein
LQLLYERGWIDINKLNQCKLNGKVDVYGNTISGTSLVEMMNAQTDFANEVLLLQSYAHSMDVESGKSPIDHS